jgi:hypothetical protein
VIIAGSERFHASYLLSADAGGVALEITSDIRLKRLPSRGSYNWPAGPRTARRTST